MAYESLPFYMVRRTYGYESLPFRAYLMISIVIGRHDRVHVILIAFLPMFMNEVMIDFSWSFIRLVYDHDCLICILCINMTL